jgi:hypothetical protein
MQTAEWLTKNDTTNDIPIRESVAAFRLAISEELISHSSFQTGLQVDLCAFIGTNYPCTFQQPPQRLARSPL